MTKLDEDGPSQRAHQRLAIQHQRYAIDMPFGRGAPGCLGGVLSCGSGAKKLARSGALTPPASRGFPAAISRHMLERSLAKRRASVPLRVGYSGRGHQAAASRSTSVIPRSTRDDLVPGWFSDQVAQASSATSMASAGPRLSLPVR